MNYLPAGAGAPGTPAGQVPEAHTWLQQVRPIDQGSRFQLQDRAARPRKRLPLLAEGRVPPALSEIRNALDLFQRGELRAEADWAARLAGGRPWLPPATVPRRAATSSRSGPTISPDGRDTPLVHMLRHASPWLAHMDSGPAGGTADPAAPTRRADGCPPCASDCAACSRLPRSEPPRLGLQTMGKPQVRVNGKLVTRSHWQTVSVRDLFFFFLLSPRPLTKDEIGRSLVAGGRPGHAETALQEQPLPPAPCPRAGRDPVREGRIFLQPPPGLRVRRGGVRIRTCPRPRIAGPVEDRHRPPAGCHPPLARTLPAAAWMPSGSGPNASASSRTAWMPSASLPVLLRKERQLAAALQACRRALEINPCLEDFHRLAMELHADLGDRLGVVWQYQACRNALQDELELKPSQRADALYRTRPHQLIVPGPSFSISIREKKWKRRRTLPNACLFVAPNAPFRVRANPVLINAMYFREGGMGDGRRMKNPYGHPARDPFFAPAK